MYLSTLNIFIKKKYIFAIVILIFFSVKTIAQNVSSPYSIIGIGDIESSYFNRTSGMANTGIAYRNGQHIILNNPASLSDLQNQLFLVELSSRAKFATYSGTSINGNLSGKDFSVERLSLGIRIKKWWGSSVGLMPFSTSNYSFSGTKYLQGTNTSLPVEYQGSGGVNRYYFANGFKITKNLSVGINTSFLGGSLTQNDSLFSPDLTTDLITTKNIYIRNWYFEYGLQYHIPISKKWEADFGATYAHKTGLRAEYSALVMDTNGDTLSNRVTKNDYFTLPNSTGFGISITKDKKISFLADYRFQDWTSLNMKGINYSLVNSSRYSAGIDYSRIKEYSGVLYETFNLQAGVFYHKSYLKIGNDQINDRGFTLGAGVNSKRSLFGYHFAFEYGVRGTQTSPVKENYTGITISISYKDFWNTKGKKYF
ncbi:MAG: hypothetical protein Q8891_05235 [Bacteroidota bacterium]|jgi:hypothetical protein|nr:hypothetical protein [Bacteroidota bacterium]